MRLKLWTYKRFVGMLCILLSSYIISAQETNQTNNHYAPLILNPALTGNFYGSVRIGGSYRDHGRALMTEGYQAAQAYVDMPLKFALRKNDWIGIGIQANMDQSGILPLQTTSMIVSAAYHFSLDRKRRQIVSIGAQYGVVQKRINTEKTVIESDFRDPGVEKRDRLNLENFNETINDLNFGIHYKNKLSKQQSITLGLVMHHLLKPSYRGIATKNYINRRITLHTRLEHNVNKRVSIHPELIFSLSQNAFNIMPQVKGFYKIKKDDRRQKNNDKVYLGLGYRVKDAIQLMLGMQYKKWDIGISYDIIVSSAYSYTGGQGGFEIGLFKIMNIEKKPKVIPVIMCPRL